MYFSSSVVYVDFSRNYIHVKNWITLSCSVYLVSATFCNNFWFCDPTVMLLKCMNSVSTWCFSTGVEGACRDIFVYRQKSCQMRSTFKLGSFESSLMMFLKIQYSKWILRKLSVYRCLVWSGFKNLTDVFENRAPTTCTPLCWYELRTRLKANNKKKTKRMET